MDILNKRAYLSAEKTYDIECKSSGSKPAANITWWRGSRQIRKPMARAVCFRIYVSKNFIFSISILLLALKTADGAHIKKRRDSNFRLIIAMNV